MARLGEALGGAATGAGIGSMFGPWGAGLGGLLGGASGLFGIGRSKKDKIKQLPLFGEQQEEYLDQLLGGAQGLTPDALGYLQSILGDEEGAFEDFERPALQQFEEEIIPSILERFSGMGARSSSALGQTLGRAGKDLETSLSQQRAGLKQSALQQLLGMGQLGLTRRTQPYVKQGRTGLMEALAPMSGQILGGIASNPSVFKKFWG